MQKVATKICISLITNTLIIIFSTLGCLLALLLLGELLQLLVDKLFFFLRVAVGAVAALGAGVAQQAAALLHNLEEQKGRDV